MRTLILSIVLLAWVMVTTVYAQGNAPGGRQEDALVRIDATFGPVTNLQTHYTPIFPSEASAPGQIYFQSGFEESWTFGAPPLWTGAVVNTDSAWHRNDFNNGWTSASGLGIDLGYVVSFMGGYSARFHTVNTPLGRRGSMITPSINLSTATDSVFVSFWWLNATGTDTLRVYASADSGVTFPFVIGFAGRTGGPWFQARGYVPGNSRTTRIKFEVASDAGMDDVLLDEIVVYQKGSGFAGALTLPGTFSSFTDAARRLSIFGVTAAATITVAAGAYTDSVTFPPIPGASAVNTIAFVASGPVILQRDGVLTANTTTLGSTTARTDDYVIGLWGADDMRFDDIDIAGGTNTERGYFVRALTPSDGANNNTIQNCLIVMVKTNTSTHGIFHNPFWALSAQSGASSNNRYLNNDIRSCGFRGILLQGGAPYLDINNEIGTSGAGTARIFDVSSTTLSANAIGVSGQNGVKIHHVDIDSVSATSGAINAILLGTGTTSGDSVVNFEISSNQVRRLVQTAGSATSILSAIRVPGHSNALRGKIYNNIVSDLRTNGTSANAVDALYHQGGVATTVEWYYNTVLLDNAAIGANGGNVVVRVDNGTAIMRDNILVNRSVQNGTGKNYVYNRTGGVLIASHNALYIDTTLANRFIGFHGSDRLTLSAWQSAAPGLDAQSVSTNPNFVNSSTLPYDLHINTSSPTAVESGGINIAGITTDYDGNARAVGPASATPTLAPNTAPDIGADEFSGTVTDGIPPLIVYSALGNTHLTANRSLATTITDAPSGVDRSAGLKPRLYYKRNGGSDWSSRAIDSAGVNVGNAWTFTVNHATIGGVVVGDTIYYYVAAADSSSNVATNPSGGSGVPPGATPPSSPNLYRILPSIGGTFTVGTAGTFPTVKAFFDSINASVVTGNVTGNITNNTTESASAVLNPVTYASGGPFRVLLQPSGGSWTVSGSIAGALIDINGARSVTIDGVSKTLTLSNTNTGGQTIQFRNDATFDTVRACIIRGVNSSATSGTIVLGTSVAPIGGNVGNSYLVIRGNDIRDGATVPANAMYSSGSAAPALNSYNSIVDNNIFNWSANGVNVTATGNGAGWTMNNNHFYDTGTPSTAQVAIEFQPGSANSNLFTVGNTISGNFVGGQAPNAGGAPWTNSGAVMWKGIHVNCGTVATTTLTNNVVQNIFMNTTVRTVVTNAFYGIHADFGTMSVTGNTVGHATTANSIVCNVLGILGGIRSTTSATAAPWPTVNVSQNTIANIVQPIDTNSVLHSIRGIDIGGSSTSYTVNSNVVHDLYSQSSNPTLAGGAAAINGIVMSSGSVGTANPGNAFCSGNTVYTLVCTNTKNARFHVNGIAINLNYGEITNNSVYDLRNASTRDAAAITPPTAIGIYLRTTEAPATPDGIVVVANNMVALGSNQTTNTSFLGFWSNFNLAGNGRFVLHHNTVSITGTASSGSNPTYCFLRGDTLAAVPRSWAVTARNNIFHNTRTGGTGKHYAVANRGVGSSTNWVPAAFDYNVMFTANPATVAVWDTTERTFAGWQAASGGDSNSVYADPQLVSTTDLHINTASSTPSPASNRGIPVGGLNGFIATDIDGNNRSRTTPDIGADEFLLRRPAAFTLLTPANAATGQPLTGTLTWQASAGASFFDVFFDTNNPPTTLVSGNQAGTTYNYSVTQQGRTYYWNVIAKNVDSTRSSTNGPFRFTTIVSAFSPNTTAINFGNVSVGASKRDSVTVTNRGTATLVIDSVRSTNAVFTVAPLSGTIFPSESTKFFITFRPTGVGAVNASVVFWHNAPTVRDTVRVSGTGTTSDVSELHAGIPDQFVLEQNFPNPFNPTTTIWYGVPHASSVELRIFNLLGQEVARIVDAVQEPGYHRVVWDGRNASGLLLGSGTYFLRIEAKPTDGSGSFVSTKKLLLMK